MNNGAKLVIKTDLANFFCYELNEMNYGSFIRRVNWQVQI